MFFMDIGNILSTSVDHGIPELMLVMLAMLSILTMDDLQAPDRCESFQRCNSLSFLILVCHLPLI